MAVALRLMRFGKKGQPTYRIVALDKRRPSKSSYIEKIGTYDPISKNAGAVIKKSRLEYWISQGALVSEGLTKLLKNKKLVQYTD